MNTKSLIALLPFLLNACGGGGGSDVTSQFVAGTWNGVLFLVENQCPFTVDDDLVISHLVNQDGTKVVLETPNGSGFSGLTTSDGFLVSNQALNSAEVAANVFCDLTIAIRYSELQSNEATVTAVTELECQSGAEHLECNTVYVGAVVRE